MSAAETVEGRRPVKGRVSCNACTGHSAGTGMSLKQRAHGSELHGYPIPRMPITFDLRQEPGAGKPHAGICAGCVLQVRSTQPPEMAVAAKPSEQPRTESCVVGR
jgi:hypothetical protein